MPEAISTPQPPPARSTTHPFVSAPSSVTSTATQTPAITIAKTTTTPTYSAVGNVLSYSLLVTNTGNVPLTSLAVSDPNAVLGACASVAIGGTLNPGQSTTCSATHPVVQADINAGSYINTATATGTFNRTTITSAPSSVTSQLISGTVSIVKNVIGGNGSFTFNGSGIQNFSQTITTAGGTGATGPMTINAGQLTITETLAAGFELSSIACTGGAPVVNLAARSVALTVVAGTNIACTFTNARRGSLTIRKNTLGGDATFGFTSSNPALPNFQLTTSGGTASSSPGILPSGTYVVTETVADGWTLSSVACTGGNSTATNVANRTATINLVAGETVVCTFINTEVRRRTEVIITNFMKRRGDLITSDTGRPRLIDRMQQGATTSGLSHSPMKVGAMGDSRNGAINFSTSLSQLRAFNAQVEANRRAEAAGAKVAAVPQVDQSQQDREDPFNKIRVMGVGMQAAATPPSNQPKDPLRLGATNEPYAGMPAKLVARPGWDVWMEGSLTYFNFEADGDKTSGHFGMLKLGADYLISPGILVGALVQFDNLKDSSAVLGYKVSGAGWMAGPYAEFRINDNLIFDVKGLWGRSSNNISPFLTYVDKFDTERWLLSARLTGSWRQGPWHFSPRAEVVGYKDTQKAYTDSLGILIREQSIALGRVIVGPEISYIHKTQAGGIIEPRLAAKALWTFSQDKAEAVAGPVKDATIDEFRLRLEAGIKFQDGNSGARLEFSGSHEGFGGSKLNATTGRAQFTIPLN